MTRLKTMKRIYDYDIFYSTYEAGMTVSDALKISQETLKKEAIKWVKTIDNETGDVTIGSVRDLLGFVTSDGNSCLYGARTILIKFFNLTEEDLK